MESYLWNITLAGILAPALTGILVDASGSYVSAFVAAGLTNVVGFVGWVFVMPAVTPIRWQLVGGRKGATASASPPNTVA